jgi:hypothetical protein
MNKYGKIDSIKDIALVLIIIKIGSVNQKLLTHDLV